MQRTLDLKSRALWRVGLSFRATARLFPGVPVHRHLSLAPFLLTVALIVIAPRPAPAQGPAPANQCDGPLSSLLPECQAATTTPPSGTTPGTSRTVGGVPSAPSNAAPGTSRTPGGVPSAPSNAAPVTSRTPGGVPPTGPSSRPGSTDRARFPQPREGPDKEVTDNELPYEEVPYRDVPTDFQRFVASSIGQVLPIFGASLFDRVPSTFAPIDRVPVTADYVVGPGDEILLRIWGQVNLDLDLTVDRAGAVFIPQAGNINVAGLQFQQLPSYLRSQLDRVFRNFDLNVNLGELRSIQIFVVGQARRPGTYTVSSLSTLVNALFFSGGPSSQGSMRRIQVKRGANVATEFDFYDLLLNGDKSKDVRLLPGDVVYIPPSGPVVAVAGSVRTPAIYELKNENKVADLIQMGGGMSAVADVQRATIERIHQDASRELVDFKLNGVGLATGIGDGDVLNVATILPRFANAVTLRGNVANPGRFSWRAGMRLRDIIPDKESLVTRDYWKRHNLLGFVPPEDRVPAEPSDEARRARTETKMSDLVPEINWTYSVIERQNGLDLNSELVPFNLGKLVLEGDETQNLDLQPGDVVTIFSQADIRVAVSQQHPKARLEGEFHTAGVFDVHLGETLGALVQRVGGLTPQAYLYGAEFMRESTRIDQQRRLDQLIDELERDLEQSAARDIGRAATQEDALSTSMSVQSTRQLITRMRTLKATGRIVLHLEPGSNDLTKLMDLPLEDGDRFLVPARPATVNVFGAVYNQNSFLYVPTLRVEDYLSEAGGPTRTADKRRALIIRADGTVVPKQGSSLFRKTFESARLNPGDSVVMPEQFFKGGVLRGLRDWTQVFSQLALGAAAINVLK